jgi:hypothetical protein
MPNKNTGCKPVSGAMLAPSSGGVIRQEKTMKKIFVVCFVFVSVNCFSWTKIWVTYEVIADFNTHTYDLVMSSDFYTNTDYYSNQVKGWDFIPHTYEYFLDCYNRIKSLQKYTREELWNNKDLYFREVFMECVFGVFVIDINNHIFRTLRGNGVTQDPEVERYYEYIGNNKYKFTYEYTYYLGY